MRCSVLGCPSASARNRMTSNAWLASRSMAGASCSTWTRSTSPSLASASISRVTTALCASPSSSSARMDPGLAIRDNRTSFLLSIRLPPSFLLYPAPRLEGA